MSKVFAIGNVTVVVKSRDHCPPHVHAECKAEKWDALFEFSFIHNEISLMDIRPIRNAPSISLINDISHSIGEHLSSCRSQWWPAMGTVGLDNAWVIARHGQIKECHKTLLGASQVKNASYDAVTGEVTVSLVNETTVTYVP